MTRGVRNTLLLSAALLGIAVVALIAHDSFPQKVARALGGDLREVSFTPHVDHETVTVTNVARMTEIRSAILAGRRLSVGSYPPTTCSIDFVFSDERSESMHVSPTGITAQNFFDQKEKAFRGLGYVVVEWRGYLRACDSGPFLGALREQNAVANNKNASR